MVSYRQAGSGLAAFALLTLNCSIVWAGNGFNVIGSGTESIGLGGADVAAIRDTNALVINPAALTQIGAARADVSVHPFYSFHRHEDSAGNDKYMNAPLNAIAGGGYAQRLESHPDVVLGASLNVQGGTGFVYNNLRTGFGDQRDDATSIFGVFRLALGGAWKVSDTLSLGATGGVSYATARQKFFPNTSNAEAGFFGFRFDGGSTVKLNAAAGILYQPVPTLRLGLSYTSRTKLPLSGGTVTMDYTAINEGRVRYDKARIDGLSLPQELSAGFAWQAKPQWLIAADVRWLDWSVVRNTALHASQPNKANVPQNLDPVSPLNLRDQYVLAVGVAYEYDDKTTLRAGINAGRNPIPKAALGPTLNLIESHEFDIGIGRKLSEKWRLDSSLQIIPKQKERYTNPLPALGDSAETFEAYILGVSISRMW